MIDPNDGRPRKYLITSSDNHVFPYMASNSYSWWIALKVTRETLFLIQKLRNLDNCIPVSVVNSVFLFFFLIGSGKSVFCFLSQKNHVLKNGVRNLSPMTSLTWKIHQHPYYLTVHQTANSKWLNKIHLWCTIQSFNVNLVSDPMTNCIFIQIS